ncbi:MAG: cation:proton antiporter [bacterium]
MSSPLLKLGSIVIIGIGCEWIADRLKLPSILILLIAGFIAGPVTGFLNPDQLFGDFLFPVVSLAVAVILFEGGLRLRVKNFHKVRSAIVSLTTVGVLTTAVLSAFLGWWLLGFHLDVAILFGTVLVITGPTVIIPIFRNTKPNKRLRTASTWEGIINDPLGSILSVMVFELIVLHNPPGVILLDGLFTFGTTVIVGISTATVGAIFLRESLNRDWIPSHLRNPMTLASVLGVFLLAESIHPESGLIATPLMGVILANQAGEVRPDILKFKEEIGLVLLSVLFILLSARFDLQGFRQIEVQSFILLGLLILIVRPLSVLIASVGTGLTWKETTALGFFAPRGIVSAAIAFLFGLKLVKLGYPEAGQFDAQIFFIIVGTVLFYGLLSPVLFRKLGLTHRTE